jgi:hypothetical protein
LVATAVRQAAAQTITGSLYGTATGTSGARLPGVTVTLSSPAVIGGQDVRSTSEQGLYRFPTLPPGTYYGEVRPSRVPVGHPVKPSCSPAKSLALDAQLGVGTMRESVTVTGKAPLIDTRNSALTNIQDAATLENIPIKRDFTQSLNLMPGVTDARYDFSPVNNVHGSTARQNVYSLDGGNTDDPTTNATAVALPPDAF